MSEAKKACSDTRCLMTRGGVCNVCGAEVPRGFGEPSLHHELVAALEEISGLEAGSRGAYSKFTMAQSIARAALQKAKQGDKQ